jgi:hypothetical protein
MQPKWRINKERDLWMYHFKPHFSRLVWMVIHQPWKESGGYKQSYSE